MYRKYFKSLLDYSLAAALLLLLSPLLLCVGFLIFVETGFPVIYRQSRLGAAAKPFTIYKFRSMYVGSAVVLRADGTLISEAKDPRVTQVGKLIRFGIDELPQLVNVLQGKMSLIGPRPDLKLHFDMYTDAQRIKYSAKPGITNLPAVCGRNALPLNDRIKLDMYYCQNLSFLLDMKIFAYTLLMPFGLRIDPKTFIHDQGDSI